MDITASWFTHIPTTEFLMSISSSSGIKLIHGSVESALEAAKEGMHFGGYLTFDTE